MQLFIFNNKLARRQAKILEENLQREVKLTSKTHKSRFLSTNYNYLYLSFLTSFQIKILWVQRRILWVQIAPTKRLKKHCTYM